jgi:hypothetical protein
VPPDAVTVALPLLLPQVALVVDVEAVNAQATQADKEAVLVITSSFEALSLTRIGQVPGGVALLPLAKVVHVVTVVPGQIMGIQFPPKHALQSSMVAELCQV